MKNNNIGCFGWGLILFLGLVIFSWAITLWYISIPIIIIAVIIYFYRKNNPEIQQRLKEKEAAKEQAEHERQELHQRNIQKWQTEDLSKYATKLSELKLKKTEYAIYSPDSQITWSESRSRTKRINYGGLTSSIHIAKGLNYRMGSIRTASQKEEYMKEIVTGALALTNKRIIVTNGTDAKSYPFTRLLRMVPYNDGVELISDSGKKVILSGFDDATRFNIYLDRLTSEE